MTFLNPIAFFGLSLLAIPVAIHLLAPRKVRQIPFSSLRWLQVSKQYRSKRIRWHQLLLFLLRAAFLILLVLALAQPMWSGQGGARPIDRLIVLDTGRTMGYGAAGETTPMQGAIEHTRALLKQVGPGDRVTVMKTGDGGMTDRAFGPWTRDPSRYAQQLSEVDVSSGSADLDGSLHTLEALLRRARPDAAVELVLVTDTRPQFWSPGAVRAIARQVRVEGRPMNVRVVDVSASPTENAWIADAKYTVGSDDARHVLVDVAAMSSQPVQRELVLEGVDGVPLQRTQMTLRPGQRRRITLDLPASAEVQGQIGKLRLEPRDRLSDDDCYWIRLGGVGPPIHVLLVDGPTHTPGTTPARAYLTTVIDALRETRQRPIQFTARRAADLGTADIARADLILLADVPTLAPEITQTLRQRLAAGAGLAVFVGPSMTPESYDATGVMPAMIGVVQHGGSAGQANVVPSRLDHPLVEGLFDPAYGDLGRVTPRAWRTLTPRDNAQTLATINGNVPFIIMRGVGAGMSLLVNSTANDAWSDLSRRRSFVPLMDRLITQVTSVDSAATHTIGRIVRMTLPDAAREAGLRAVGPNDESVSARMQSTDGQSVAFIGPPKQPGIYRATYRSKDGDEKSTLFVVQTDRAGSQLARTEESELRKLWNGVEVRVTHAAFADESASTAAQVRIGLTPWAIALAFLVLMAEMMLVHRRCPAMAPNMAESFVANGMLRPRMPENNRLDNSRTNTQTIEKGVTSAG
ncbi:MAG: BatA domain-containing protein [bacterium]